MGKVVGGGHLPHPPPLKMSWSVCVLQMLSKVSVDEVFMHYFEKVSSALPPDLHRGSAPGLLSFRPGAPHCPPLEKKSCRRPWNWSLYDLWHVVCKPNLWTLAYRISNSYFLIYQFSIFTALHVMQTRYCDENSVRPSVCPSVCPSVTRVYCDKTVERSVQIYIPYERTFSLVFW